MTSRTAGSLMAMVVAMGGAGIAVCANAEVAEADQVSEPYRDGVALSAYWSASAAEYQASAEYILDLINAPDLRRGGVSGAAMAEFLQMFGGGGGAPQDLVKRRVEPRSSADEL